jgi:hypothetical protein
LDNFCLNHTVPNERKKKINNKKGVSFARNGHRDNKAKIIQISPTVQPGKYSQATPSSPAAGKLNTPYTG